MGTGYYGLSVLTVETFATCVLEPNRQVRSEFSIFPIIALVE